MDSFLTAGTTVCSRGSHRWPHRASSHHQQSRVKVIAGGTPTENLLEEFPRLTKPTEPSRGAAQHYTSRPDKTLPVCSLPPAPPCPRSLGRGQGRVRRRAERRYSQMCRGPMVVRSPSSGQEGQKLETLWRLSSSQRSHHP